jgi:hypothetical protein
MYLKVIRSLHTVFKHVLKQCNHNLLRNKAVIHGSNSFANMNLLKQCQFYGVRLRQLADASGFTQSYVRQVLLNERRNDEIKQLAHTALHNRKEELLNALLKESA